MIRFFVLLIITILSLGLQAQHKLERLDRGLYACRNHSNNGTFISWRIYGTEWENGAPTVSFNVYRNGTELLTSTPITKSNYLDAGAAVSATYTVKTVVNGLETETFGASVWTKPWWGIKLSIPAGGTTPAYTVTNNGNLEDYPNGQNYTYSANDMSVADVDGDGQLEYILKWDPSNSRDNSQGGFTGNVYLDCYEFDGTLLWRIDLGRNIRAGAHYTQFMVYDFDNDGKAELACKTAPNTKGGDGQYLAKGPASNDNDGADYRTTGGWPGFVISGPEYLTIFNGQTGVEMQTVNYLPNRIATNSWGKSTDNTNRLDRYLAGVAYLDGQNPSLVMCRGYYGRTALTAWDWDGTNLTQRWAFDNDGSYSGQGNHSLSVGDLDGDGFDEIQYGSMAIDHDGKGLYTTGFGHGDAGHLSDLDPSRPGLEFFMPHEEGPNYGSHLVDPANGNVLWSTTSGGDNGRGVCYDVDENYFGAECWSYDGTGMRDIKGNVIHTTLPTTAGGGVTINFGVWWDGDLMRELFDRNVITKYHAGDESTSRTYTMYSEAGGVGSNNGSKSNPSLLGDILGDWREEIILRSTNSDYVYIFTTTAPTEYNYYTLLHDIQYREAIAWQNVAYNQPPHPSFYLGVGMSAPPTPNIVYTSGTPDCSGAIGGTALIDECGTCTGGTTGKYPCVQFDEGYYTITAYANDLSLASTNDFTQQTTTDLEQTQVWKFEKSGDNYKIYSPAQQAYLSYETAGDGADLSFSGTNTDFRFEQDPNGNYVVLPVTNSSFVLDVPGCDATIGLAMNFWSRLNNDCQAFVIEPAETLFDCAGTWQGDAYLDNCATCVGGTTGVEACNVLEVETACAFDGTIDTNHSGFSGSGFLNLTNVQGSSCSMYFYANEAATESVELMYSNSSATTRPVEVTLNGTTAIATLDFPATADWDTWATATLLLDVKKGLNEIILTSLTTDGPANFDKFIVSNNLMQGTCGTQTLTLTEGWNLISTHILSDDMFIPAFLPNATIVKSQDGFFSSVQPDYLNSLQTIEAGEGYLVYNSKDETLTITGIEASSLLPAELRQGWNLVGVPSSTDIPVTDFDATILIKDFNGFYEIGNTLNSINVLEPGKAYFIKQ